MTRESDASDSGADIGAAGCGGRAEIWRVLSDLEAEVGWIGVSREACGGEASRR
jgi:hypothetical protein